VPTSFTLAALLAIAAGLRLARMSSLPLRGAREGEVL
jgi:hypothetical protein